MKRSTLVIISFGIAAALLLIAAVVLHHARQASDETDKAADIKPLSSSQSSDSFQKPRVKNAHQKTEAAKETLPSSVAETAVTNDAPVESAPPQESVADMDEEARQYDMDGGVGDPPKGWKDDYSHWDASDAWPTPIGADFTGGKKALEMLGNPYHRFSGTVSVFQPANEDRQRMQELIAELGAAEQKGLLTSDAKEGYVVVQTDPHDGATLRAHPDFVERYAEASTEMDVINKRGMRETPGGIPLSSIYIESIDSNFRIRYYRRQSDQSLMREATLPNGEVKGPWVAAGPPSPEE